MTYGVTTTGFNLKLLADLLNDIETSQRSSINAGLKLTSDSVLGQLNGVFAASLSELWEVAEAVYRFLDPSSAEGDQLDMVCALLGITRRPATKSTVTLTLTFTDAATVPAGSYVSQSGNPTAIWQTLTEVVATGAGTQTVEAEATVTGATVAAPHDIDTILTTTSGWSDVDNAAAATTGEDRETDAELRTRRLASLSIAGAGTVDALQAAIGNVDGVASVAIYENTGDVTDGNGVSAHAFEAVVYGTFDDDEVAQAIWDNKPAGIPASWSNFGVASDGTAVDVVGNSHTVRFTEPSGVTVHLSFTITHDTDYPTDGDTQIKNALVAWGAELGAGADVVVTQLYPVIYQIPGVLDVTVMRLGLTDPPVGTTNISINTREIAVISATNIDITS